MTMGEKSTVTVGMNELKTEMYTPSIKVTKLTRSAEVRRLVGGITAMTLWRSAVVRGIEARVAR
jgi:hypothetical protein